MHQEEAASVCRITSQKGSLDSPFSGLFFFWPIATTIPPTPQGWCSSGPQEGSGGAVWRRFPFKKTAYMKAYMTFGCFFLTFLTVLIHFDRIWGQPYKAIFGR